MTALRTSGGGPVRRVRALVEWPDAPSASWRRGFLAGVFDAEGSRSAHALRMSTTDDEIVERTVEALEHFGFTPVVEDRRRADRLRTVRVTGGVPEHLRLARLTDPAIRRERSLAGTALESAVDLRVVAVEDLGLVLPMVDLTTGTGDFIANGVVSHNCFARGTHAWLDLDTGEGFDRELVVKTNVAELVAAEVARPSWQREHVALGTNTDPYQRAEGRYRLVPGVLGALHRSGTPFSVLTKGTLLRRDLPLLVAAARDVPVGVAVSVAIWDEELHRAVEPGAPSPRARLDLVRAVRDAGLDCAVLLAPVLPGLTDSSEHLDAAIGAIAAAGATGLSVMPLHLRPGAREWWQRWLGEHRPDLWPLYADLYRRGAYLPPHYRDALAARVAPLLARHRLEQPGRHRHPLGHRAPAGAAAAGGAAAGTPGETPGDALPGQMSLL